MFKYIPAFCAFSLLLLPGSSAEGQSFFTARLTTGQQPSGSSGQGSGTAAFVLTEEGLRFMVSFDSLTGPVSVAHFHRAPAGENGGVVRTITEDILGNSASGVWTASDPEPLTPELVRALWDGDLYLNVHTAANPGGEIRGQIYPSSGTGFTANLTTSQENHDVESEATGTASVLFAPSAVIYAVTVTGLTGDLQAAHFHQASAGVNGGVVKTITGDFEGPTAFGMWTRDDDEPLTDELIGSLILGNLYLNVHTAEYGAGEIRGQVVLNSGLGMWAQLDTEQPTDEIESDGAGTAALTLNEVGVSYDITVSGLTGPMSAAHFHNAPAGANGGVVRTIEFVDGRATGVWTEIDSEPLTEELLQELLAGNIYVNIHTADYPAGEVRGQVMANFETALSADLDPFQQQAGVESSGVGTAAMRLTSEGLEFSVTVDSLTEPFSAAHFHRAPSGENGGVVRTITGDFVGNTAIGTWTAGDAEPLTEELIAELLKGNLYLNVHTSNYPGGEIRGQVLPSGGASMTASLDATQQPGGEVASSGSGTASVTVTPAGVVYAVTVDSLTEPIANAHFHQGEIGVNGGVVKSIFDTFEGNTARGVWRASDDEPLTPELLEELVTGGLYLNVHTSAFPGGEIRGQVLIYSGSGSAVQLDPDQQTGDVSSPGRGTASLTLNGVGVSFDLTHEGLTGPLAAAHFHNGPFGENGPVVRTITGDFGSPTASGLWTSEDDEPLTEELLRAYIRGETYLNLHTAAFPGGEIRGQVLPGVAVVTAIEKVSAEIPERIEIRQNYPNPFNPETRIEFALDQALRARLEVYNALGQVVALLVDEEFAAGTYRVTFRANDLPSGVYFARLRAGGRQVVEKMVMMK